MNGEILYDPITGEHIISADSPTVYMGARRKAQVNEYAYYNPRRGYKFRRNSRNAMQIMNDAPIPGEISMGDLGRFYQLIMIACPLNGLISVKTGKRMWRAASTAELAKSMNMSLGGVRNLMSRLAKAKMIKNVKKKNGTNIWYYINPLFIAPFYITKEVFELWKDELKPLIPSGYWELIEGEYIEHNGEFIKNPREWTTSDGRRVNEDGEIIEEETDTDGDRDVLGRFSATGE